MTQPDPTAPQPLAWHPTSHNCPRCSQPLKARGTPTFNKIIELLCTKCGWRINIETIRKATKAIAIPPNENGEDEPNGH